MVTLVADIFQFLQITDELICLIRRSEFYTQFLLKTKCKIRLVIVFNQADA